MLNASSYYRKQNSESTQTLVTEQILPKAANSKVAARRQQNLHALCDLKRGEVGKVSFIRAESTALENIFSMGFSFGGEVTVEAMVRDALEVNLGDFNVLLGLDVAAKIFVELVYTGL